VSCDDSSKCALQCSQILDGGSGTGGEVGSGGFVGTGGLVGSGGFGGTPLTDGGLPLGASGSGGEPTSAGGGSSTSEDAGLPGKRSSTSGGCGCSVPASPTPSWPALVSFATLAAMSARRRRRSPLGDARSP